MSGEEIQKYSPEVKRATAQIVQQLPPEINSLALQAKIAEAIVTRSEARIIGAIQEALAYRPSTQPAQQNPVNYSISVGDINLNVDNSQNINYWVDASQHCTDNSSHNYWADNRHYTDNSDNSSHFSTEIFGFDLSTIGLLALIALVIAAAFSQPCGQELQRQQQQLQQQESVL